MPDLLDQLEDAKHHTAPTAPPVSATRAFTFVYQIDGQWYDGTFTGSYSDCGSHIITEVAKRGSDIDKIRWARGHVDDGQVRVHPKKDGVAEARLLDTMKYRAARSRKRKFARR